MKLSLSGATAIALSLVVSSGATLGQASSSLLPQILSPFPNASFSTPNAVSRNPRYSPVTLYDPTTSLLPRPPECPPCNPFNCVLPAFSCLNNGELPLMYAAGRVADGDLYYRPVQRLQRAMHLPLRLWRRGLLQASYVRELLYSSCQLILMRHSVRLAR